MPFEESWAAQIEAEMAANIMACTTMAGSRYWA